MKTFIAWFCTMVLFFVVLWEHNIIVEQSGQIQTLNLRPNEINTCVEDENLFHIIHVEFNDDTTKDYAKYALTSYQRYEFNENGCTILHTHLNYKNPYDAHFGINEFDKEECEKIKKSFTCDIKY